MILFRKGNNYRFTNPGIICPTKNIMRTHVSPGKNSDKTWNLNKKQQMY